MKTQNDLQTLDAVASEHGRILAFRACEETGEFEPVFVRIGGADVGDDGETAAIAITDTNGMSLGCYVMSRARLDAALADPEAVPAAEHC